VAADYSSEWETISGVTEGTDSSGGKETEVVDLSGSKTIDVKFEVENGGGGLWYSAGIVSTQDDTYLVYDSDCYASDFTITITVPASDQYLNIRWAAKEYEFLTDNSKKMTFVTAKMPVSVAGNYTIGLDYNGIGSVATSNLNDVHIVTNYNMDSGANADQNADWRNAVSRSIPD